MAFFEIIEGRPGQGKSLYTAYTALRILRRNAKWLKLGRAPRRLYSNIKFNKELELSFGVYPQNPNGLIVYWSDVEVITQIKDSDVIWDEIAVHLDSRLFASLSSGMKRLLSQYRKRGLDIYANTQDLGMVDINARRVISGARTAYKIIGSGDPSASKPEVNRIWGLIMLRDIRNFAEVSPEKKVYDIIPEFMFITRELVELYDTTQDIGAGLLPKLKHVVQFCEHYDGSNPEHVCNFSKITHI